VFTFADELATDGTVLRHFFTIAAGGEQISAQRATALANVTRFSLKSP
jgi:hypothetical protein